MQGAKQRQGFTILELLIVIVIIAILAVLTLVAYSGIQAHARNSQRQHDIQQITQALELYYIDNGAFPNSTNYTPGSTAINASWSTTADGSWANLQAVLQPYVSKLPTPPTSSSTPATSGGDNYDYFGFSNSSYCGSSKGQGYLLVYHLEGMVNNQTIGTCSGTPLGYYTNPATSPPSNYRVVK